MKRILVIGPSLWDDAAGRPPFAQSPLELRREIALRLRTRGLDATLLENRADHGHEDLLEKFRHVVRHETTAVLVFWPPRAKMQTTFDELLLLREWRRGVPSIIILANHRVARVDVRRLEFLEPGGRSRYLDSLAGLDFHAVPWRNLSHFWQQLNDVADRLALRPPASPRGTGSDSCRPARSGS